MDVYGNEMTELQQILSLSITLLINRNTIALQWQCSVSINSECKRREGYSVIEKLINEEETIFIDSFVMKTIPCSLMEI